MTLELVLFYLASAVAIFATLMTITRHNAAHALLYLIVSLLAVAVLFYLLGAPFAAGLEVIVYAGAIMVLFVFVIMMLNQGNKTVQQEKQWLRFGMWIGPGILCLVLFLEVLTLLGHSGDMAGLSVISAKQVGIRLFGPYLLAVELASMLLMVGLVGAYHLGRPLRMKETVKESNDEQIKGAEQTLDKEQEQAQ